RSMRYMEQQLFVRVHDVKFVVDQLEQFNRPSGKFFGARLDLNRLGIFGYSFGGAVAAQACWLDRRFKAGIDMEGSLFGEVAEDGVRQPFFFMGDAGTPVASRIPRNPKERLDA